MKVIDPELRRLIGEAGKYSKDMDKDHQLTFEKAIDEVMGIIEAYETLYGDNWADTDVGEKAEAPIEDDNESALWVHDIEKPLKGNNEDSMVDVFILGRKYSFDPEKIDAAIRFPICEVCPRFRNDVGIQYDYAMCEHGLFRERDL